MLEANVDLPTVHCQVLMYERFRVKRGWKINAYYIVQVRIPKALRSPSVSLSVIRTFPPRIPTECPFTIHQI